MPPMAFGIFLPGCTRGKDGKYSYQSHRYTQGIYPPLLCIGHVLTDERHKHCQLIVAILGFLVEVYAEWPSHDYGCVKYLLLSRQETIRFSRHQIWVSYKSYLSILPMNKTPKVWMVCLEGATRRCNKRQGQYILLRLNQGSLSSTSSILFLPL